VLDQVKATYPMIAKTWVDVGFKNHFVEHAAEKLRGQSLPRGEA
jgi:hypothetical protein